MSEADKEKFRKAMDKLVELHGLDKTIADVKKKLYSPNNPEHMELYYCVLGYLNELKRDEKISSLFERKIMSFREFGD